MLVKLMDAFKYFTIKPSCITMKLKNAVEKPDWASGEEIPIYLYSC